MIKATIFIPTYNGEDNLAEALTAVFNQKVDFEYEVLIYDSESKDQTVDIIKEFAEKHQNLEWHQIKKSDFSHGKTRQLAAEEARGEFVVFLTQDATPAHDRWLFELLKPFDLSEKIVGVVGQQDPRPNCVPMMKYEIKGAFANQGVNNGITVYQRNDNDVKGVFTQKTFYSDVNSAARRDFLLHVIPYKPVPYSEDQLFGREIIDNGFMKAYSANGYVLHSNEVPLKDYRKRLFDEVYNMRLLGSPAVNYSYWQVIKNTAKGSIQDFTRILKDQQYGFVQKMGWFFVNPLFQFEKWRGVRLGNMVVLNDDEVLKKYSLEKGELK